MGRRSNYINHISERDMDAFRILWNCQHVPRELLKISDNRLESYRKQGIVDVCKNKDNETIIRCNAKGHKYLSKLDEFKDRKPYQSPTATAHNVKLAETYSSLSREEQQAWRTEKELREFYNSRLEEIRTHDHDRWEQLRDTPAAAPDGGIVISGEIQIIYEIVTGTYGQAELEAHEAFIQVMGVEASYIHA